VRPSFLTGDQHSLIQTGFIDGLTDSRERIQPPLAALTLIEEVPDSLFDQLVAALLPPAGEFLLDLLSQIDRQRDLHSGSPHFIQRFRGPRDCGGIKIERRTVHDGPAGPVRDVLEIRYRSYGCADTGVEGEQFAENIGTLRLQTSLGSGAIALAFPSSQEYEVLLRDADGNVLWAWPEGQVFTQELHTREVSGEWRTTVEIPKPPSTGEPKAAIYTVQAWMTTMGAALQFAATVPVTITTGLE
jgi:hypothetical protein